MVKPTMRVKAARRTRARAEGSTTGDARGRDDGAAAFAARPRAASLERKAAKRARFLDKIRVAERATMKRLSSGRKKSLGTDMKSLELSLADVGRNGAARARVRATTAKTRAKLVARETTRMQAVLEHPTFKSNPIAAISNHIVSGIERTSASGEKGRAPEKKKREKKRTPQQERDASGHHVVGATAPSGRKNVGLKRS
ncbi:ribosome biogenesis protein SLX9-domain-containing protein [Ostreococcus tauri]|uniref:Ribosome biogenesis protein SLX9-domain-containing protein n=1 Tax=Ostreococcus tauri TaxID=70448 RepID=A0A1Y5IKF6_OSTTA|nr:ribosome biogenesis protein SLX9-domain-containing protein [Ostreococcus tauri]